MIDNQFKIDYSLDIETKGGLKMLSKERIAELKDSFYGWEWCVENNVQPTMTHEEIELLMNLFIDIEDLREDLKKCIGT